MSELKAFNSERIYWAVEQVEREAGDIDRLHLDDNWFFLKSEADKVIVRNKYKRCLAMALLSLEKRETYRTEYEEWCLKWYKRWLELAEMFK